MSKYKSILYFGNGSYRHIDEREFKILKRTEDAIIEILKSKKQCRTQDLVKYLKLKTNMATLSKYVLLLCTATEIPGKPPKFITKTGFPKRRPYYKKGVYIMRNPKYI